MKTVLSFLFMLIFGVSIQAAPLQVAVSIPTQAEWVRRIAGPYVQVMVLIPPGSSHELYEPSPKQLKQLSKAKLVFWVGTIPFEKTFSQKLKSLYPTLKPINTSEQLLLMMQPGTQTPDPHIWMSPVLAKAQIQRISTALQQEDPSHKAYYQTHTQALLKEMDRLSFDCAAQLKGKQGKRFIALHPFLGYFARDFGLVQVGIETEEKPLTGKALTDMIREAKKSHIRLVIVDQNAPAPQATSLSKAISAKVIKVNSTPADYSTALLDLAKTLAKTL
ncbi:MAG: metal ABC transporter solute-binding protein, Zn/Mn family [Candidatus Margulisiibacteriota bacterium]